MTASEASYVGLAKQTAKGSVNSTPGEFDYLLFTAGSSGPQNMVIPLDQEVGGGPLLRNVVKVGVTSAAAFQIIPRPATLGHFLAGVVGPDTKTGDGTLGYTHTFKLGADPFDAPYYTLRSAPGGLFGEQLQDCRVAALALNWKSPDFVRGAVAFQGGLPTPITYNNGTWSPAVDGSPQFITPVCDFQLDGAPLKVLQGSINFGVNIPMDEQFVAGSYSPDGFDINSRSIAMQFVMKINDGALYNKLAYDGAGGSAWAVEMFRNSAFTIKLASDQNVFATATPFSLQLEGDGKNDQTANVAWSVTPVNLAAGRQVTAVVTGIFMASPSGAAPITATLINEHAAAY